MAGVSLLLPLLPALALLSPLFLPEETGVLREAGCPSYYVTFLRRRLVAAGCFASIRVTLSLTALRFSIIPAVGLSAFSTAHIAISSLRNAFL